ncbi:hypothetical protein [Planotetraspora phitsanulokensis]
MTVDTQRIIAALRRRIDQLSYENAVLSAAVDQQREQIVDLIGDGENGG